MKNYVFALLALCLTIAACNQNNKTSAIDKRFCGRWMTVDGSNRERYSFKKDGTFIDVFYTDMLAVKSYTDLPKPKSWRVAGNQLLLTYSFNRYLLHLFKLPTEFTMAYSIQDNTDSSLVLITRATKRYPKSIITLKKMKLNGRYIEE